MPIDDCYKLVGLVRSRWRGFTGGVELWDEIKAFFIDLQVAVRPMSELNFSIERVAVVGLAVTPQLVFTLRINAPETSETRPIQAVLLRVQIRIEPTKRSYPATAAPGLVDLFGEPERWCATMRSMLWTHANLIVPAFSGSTQVDLPVECTYDFNVGATKYFAALDDGEIPLCFLFSGTCFYQTDHGMQASQISWEQEATFRFAA